jgi:type VI secretion system secreted protein VgrG
VSNSITSSKKTANAVLTGVKQSGFKSDALASVKSSAVTAARGGSSMMSNAASALGAPDRTITMRGAALPGGTGDEAALLLRSIHGEEVLSRVYNYAIDCCTPLKSVMPSRAAANLDLKAMIGKELTVSIQLEGIGGLARIGAGTREISGIVTEANFVGQSEHQSFYRLVLQPWLSLLAQRTDFRIFQKKSVVEIVEEVFENYMYS